MKIYIERLGLWLLNLAGTQIVYVSVTMNQYKDEIMRLCWEEEPMEYPGYFKYRRVMTRMILAHPAIDKRELSKAVQLCSDSIGILPGEVGTPPHQETSA